MDLLDNNIVTVAIPNIQQHLGASPTSIQWMNAGYTLAFAVMLITGGRLGDIFGRKRMFLTGVAGFMAASGMCAIAQSPEFLVGARVVQGGAAAVMVP
ncbi:MFS transporter, partial [Frankia casuarinae]|uniref:MFS transporter n=2 Tax=Frankia TaxID=1854 RepID=UPI0036F29ACB